VDFASLTVSREEIRGSGSPRVVLVAAEQGRRLFTAGADRAEVLSAVHAASAVLLDLASTEPIDLSAVEGGEYGLRAWVMACAAIALRLSGPARSRIDETGRSRARVSPSTTDFSPQRIRDIAVEAVSAVSSIRKAEMMVCGADAAAVGSFATPALEESAEVYALGGDRRRTLSDELTFAGAGYDFPWELVRNRAESLAVLYSFSPFRETGSAVASQRMRVFAENFAVISCSFLQHKKQDPAVETISRPYVASKEYLPLTPSWASWPQFRTFAERAARSAGLRMSTGAQYRRLYTRAMWAPSLYAGMRIRLDHPDLPWTAEFSDPLSLDVEGETRGGAIPRDAFTAPLIAKWESDFGSLSASDLTIFRFAELLVFG